MEQNNIIRVNLETSTSGNLHITTNSPSQAVSATNNKAQDFADEAKECVKKIKEMLNKTKGYMELTENLSKQNTNVTIGYIDDVKNEIEDKINQKQPLGDYALTSDIPENVSELINDADYVNENELNTAIAPLELPSQEGKEGLFLQTDGSNVSWVPFSSASLFDTKISDHYLTYEETKGWALQGTYVYKEAIAGSRYGYPNFYNKVVEEFEGSAIIASPNKIDYTLQDGVLTIKAGTVLKFPDGFESDGVTKKYKYKKLDSDVKYSIKTTLNGGSYYFSMYESSSQTLRQTLWAKATTDTTATSGIIYDESQNLCYTASSGVQTALPLFKLNLPATDSSSVALVTSIAQIYQGNSFLEETPTFAPYAPIYQNTNGHLFYDIADKPGIDELFSSTGMAWLYGVDTTEERVFLPRNNWFEQLTLDEAEIGQSVEAGLPNISGTIFNIASQGKSVNLQGDGAFQTYSVDSSGAYGTSLEGHIDGFSFDASRSNPIYGNSETVQPNAVKKLLYICVGNTESQSAITDVVDVTTTENDTTPLFTGMYFDFKPNNASWLIAGGQANSGGIYTTCYNELVNVLNGETKYGDLKVVDTADMIAGVDYSEYWKVNQDAMTFITPIAISNKALSGAVVGNGTALGVTDGTNNYGIGSYLTSGGSYERLGAGTTGYGQSLPTTVSGAGTLASNNTLLGITTDSSKSGIIAEQSTAQLYFKVANAVQNLDLLDVGEVLEAVGNVVPNNSELITGYCVPDYSAMVNIAISNGQKLTWTAPVNCYVYLQTQSSSSCTAVIFTGNSTIPIDRQDNTNSNGKICSASAYVAKGQEILLQPVGTVNACYYAPLKGVN